MNYNSAKLLALLLLVLALVQCASASTSGLPCREEERAALLHIKAHLSMPRDPTTYTSGIEPKYFSYWKGKDCCRWERVVCDATTGHVTQLDMGIYSEPVPGSGSLLNATMFLPLRQLRSLSLSGLGISGFIGAGLNTWYNLTMLENLDLSYNNLDGSIVSPLASVPSLRMLQLSHNNIRGNLPFNEFESWSNFSKLETLDLSANDLNTSIFSSLSKVSSLRELYLDSNYMGADLDLPMKELTALSLEVVSLQACWFTGNLPYLGYWYSLKALSLANNNLNGTITSKGVCRLEILQELDLSGNSFTGNLPLCIGNLTSLRLVDMSHNQFQVNFPSFIFERLVSLSYLSLSQNQLEGALYLRLFSNHSYLEVLRLSTNALNFRLDIVNLPFQLLDLKLANCIIDAEPNFLFSQHKLQSLDLSNTHSRGLLPISWLLENNSNLFQLDLHKNFFTGSLQIPFLTHEKLSLLDVSDNRIGGELPVDMTTRLPNLLFLNLSKNYFQGPFPLISTSRLRVLDLSINNLTDDIHSFLKIQSSFFKYIDLSHNKFYGSFPNSMNSTIFNNIESGNTLLLNDNYITGEIPTSICSTNMNILDVSRNKLNGVLPNCIGRSSLFILKLSENYLKGSLPFEICDMTILVSLDLSNNMLSGSIPPCYNATFSLYFVDLSQNILTGNFPITWLNFSSAINIRKNKLSGEVPIVIGGEYNLVMLQAGENQFEGNIPKDICQFKYLRIIDLSQNNINSQIPSCIINMGPKDNDISSSVDMLIYSFYVGKLKIDANYLLRNEYYVSVEKDATEYLEMEFMSKERMDIYGENILPLEGVIDLSSNKLTGNIPENIGQMTWLITLNLSNNHLSGGITDSISDLHQLQSLDLSHNLLTGVIPRDLTRLTLLESFSVAFNNLSGPTLSGKQFDTFDYRSYEGNPNLCGPPLSKSCFPTVNTTNERDDNGSSEGTDFLMLIGSFCIFFVASFWGFMIVLYFKGNWRYALFNWVDQYGDMIYVRVVLFARKIGA